MLETKNIHAGYSKDILILYDVSIKANEKYLTSIIGPNGVGKSTFLKVLYGLLTPTKGEINFGGENITNTPSFEMPLKGISYIPQQQNIFPYMTVQENLEIGAWTIRKKKDLIKERIQEVYERYPVLYEKRNHHANELSGGQQRMIEISRALMTDPTLLIIDEPTAGLAPILALDIYEILTKLRDEEKRTILLVDQNIEKAFEYSDYIYVFEMGSIMCDGYRSEFQDIKQRLRDWF